MNRAAPRAQRATRKVDPQGMGFEFLARTIRATALTACLAATAAAVLLDPGTGLSVLVGAAWSLANLKLLETFVRAIGPRTQVEPLRAMLALLLKGPLLYGAGWWLLASGLSAPAMLGGFMLPFFVVTLLAVAGRLLPARRSVAALGLALVLLGAGVHGAAASPDAAHAPADTAHSGVATHAGDAHAADAHGEEHAAHPELPNFITYLRAAYPADAQPGWLKFLHTWENAVFSMIAALLLIAVFGLGARPKRMIPTGLQNLSEALLGGLHDFFLGILGPEGKKYVPFVGSLFLYIVTMNWMGLLPFMKAPTSSLNTTLALALCVFVYVQYIGISKNGIGGYLYHFAGQPKDAIGWGTAILLFPLEIMGELIKPLSLGCRLFGNILSEDILLAVLVGLGVTMLAAMNSPIGIPLQLPFLVLSTLFGLIQGLVFSLLASIYIVMMLPHDDHGHHGDHAGAQIAHH